MIGNYRIGQQFDNCPADILDWCRENNAYVHRYDDGLLEIRKVVADEVLEARQVRLEKLKQSHKKALEDAVVDSSVGFPIDADDASAMNITQLLLAHEDKMITFYDASNVPHFVNREDLEVMLKEVAQCKAELFRQKQNKRNRINSAETVKDVKAVKLGFKYPKYRRFMDINKG